MGVVVPHKAIEAISTSKDPKKTIQELAGDLDGIEVIGDRVLVGIYMRPEKTAGGIIRPTMNKEEDVWQGKIGLVLKWGPDAFRNPETGELYEQDVNVGDWVGFYHWRWQTASGWSDAMPDRQGHQYYRQTARPSDLL